MGYDQRIPVVAGLAYAERLQQLPSTYSYFFSFGISYSFGSIFTGVLNPRFAGF